MSPATCSMMWLRGRIETNRLPPAGIVRRQRSVEARSIAWVIVTPLGLPVDPEVNRISIGWSGAVVGRAASASTSAAVGGSMMSSRSRTGRAERRGIAPGSIVAPVPMTSAAGFVSAEIRSTVSGVIRASSGTRITFARGAANSAAAKPGPGAPWTMTVEPVGTAPARRAAALSTAVANSR